MSWFAQLGHVLKKDVRESGWLLLAYAFGVWAFVVKSRWTAGATRSPTDGWMLLFVICGMVVAAGLVQTDSPTRRDAFWATLPLHPTAVLVAKLLLVAIAVLGVGVLGQYSALAALDVPGRQLPLLLGQSALVYGKWLLIAIVLAALSGDVRTFVVASGVTIIGVYFAMIRMWEFKMLASAEGLLITTAGGVGAVLFLVYLYKTHDGRVRSWLGGLLAAAALVLSLTVPFAALQEPQNVPGVLDRIKLDVAVMDPGQLSQPDRLQLRFSVTGQHASERVKFTPKDSGVVLRFRSRPNEVLKLDGQSGTQTPQPLLVGAGTRWLGQQPDTGSSFMMTFPLTPGQREAMRSGIENLTVDGFLEVDESSVVAVLPRTVRASAVQNGVRVVVKRVEHDYQMEMVAVYAMPSQPGLAIRGFGAPRELEYALVNSQTKEALALATRETAWRGGMLILPGIDLVERATTLVPDPSTREVRDQVLTDDWYRASNVVAVRWTSLAGANRRITYQTTVTP